MSSQKLNIQEEKNFFCVVHNGSPIIKVTKDIEAIAQFLSGLSSSKFDITVKKKEKTRKKKVAVENKNLTKAIQLEKKYTLLKRKFYKSKVMKSVPPSSVQFEHFLKAAEIIERHEAKIAKFLRAQVEGLKFVGGGVGVFPKPNQLSTPSAEQRLLDYDRQKNVKVELTDEERVIELQHNKKYVALHGKVKNNTASMFEAMYVKECQLARRGEVQSLVDSYIKQLKKRM